MPIRFKGYDECEKCKRYFTWVHFEWIKNNLDAPIFRVEKLPEKPWARQVNIVDNNRTEYIVECPHCGFINIFIYDIED